MTDRPCCAAGSFEWNRNSPVGNSRQACHNVGYHRCSPATSQPRTCTTFLLSICFSTNRQSGKGRAPVYYEKGSPLNFPAKMQATHSHQMPMQFPIPNPNPHPKKKRISPHEHFSLHEHPSPFTPGQGGNRSIPSVVPRRLLSLIGRWHKMRHGKIFMCRKWRR